MESRAALPQKHQGRVTPLHVGYAPSPALNGRALHFKKPIAGERFALGSPFCRANSRYLPDGCIQKAKAMADKQQHGNREAKKPKKAKSKTARLSTGLGIIDRAKEEAAGKR